MFQIKISLNNLAAELNADGKKIKEEKEALAIERAEFDSKKSSNIDLDNYFDS